MMKSRFIIIYLFFFTLSFLVFPVIAQQESETANTKARILEITDRLMDYVDLRVKNLNSIEHLSEVAATEIEEDLADLNSRLGIIEQELSGPEDEQTTGLELIAADLNNLSLDIQELNEGHLKQIIKDLNTEYLEAYTDLYEETLEIIDTNEEKIGNSEEIRSELEEMKENLDRLEDQYSDEAWQDVKSQSERIFTLLSKITVKNSQ